MSADTPAKKPGIAMNRGQKAFVIVGVGGGLFLWIVAGMTPIPHGTENREKAQPFLKQQFPDRSISPADSVTAPVAAVFELIRSGKPDEARRAMDFARDQQFGYAAPYVIERLGSGDPELERSALDFLRTISGRDYGQDADAWRAWWRDPPTKITFMLIGQTTLRIGIPATYAIVGIVLLAIGRKLRRPKIGELSIPLVLLAWFMAIMGTAMQSVGSAKESTFGASPITYYADHGSVVGLEDARAGGGPLWIGLIALWVVGGLTLMVICAVVIMRSQPVTTSEADQAEVV